MATKRGAELLVPLLGLRASVLPCRRLPPPLALNCPPLLLSFTTRSSRRSTLNSVLSSCLTIGVSTILLFCTGRVTILPAPPPVLLGGVVPLVCTGRVTILPV